VPKKHKLICEWCGEEVYAFNATRYCCAEHYNLGRASNGLKKFLSLDDYSGIDVKTIKKYLIKINGHKCSICDKATWRGQDIPLTLDHIDGNALNNNSLNFRIICPNCDAQLPTYCGRNRGNGREAMGVTRGH
jgi:hypothetical protein